MKTHYLILRILLGTAAIGCTPEEGTDPSLTTNPYPTSEDIVSIPVPPEGMRWVLNEQYSDEFNGSELDSEKWFCLGVGTYWSGRAPGLFEKENVNVTDGNLTIRGRKKETPYIIDKDKDGLPDSRGEGKSPQYFDIGCGGVVSVEQGAHFGYYESKVKASATGLSTTFWLTHRSWNGSSVQPGVNQPENVPAGTFTQELDICETIGRKIDDSSSFYNTYGQAMHSNLHFRHIATGTNTQVDWNLLSGTHPTLDFPNNEYASDNYNIYGCWWKEGGKEMSFYVNNGKPVDLKLLSKDNQPFWFSDPMGINMVCETYDWVPFMDADGDKVFDKDNDGIPDDQHPSLYADFDDPKKNTTYYDWVRSYNLYPIDENVELSQPTICFEDNVHLTSKPRRPSASSKEVKFSYQYSANTSQELALYIYDAEGNSCFEETLNAYAGYGCNTYMAKVDLELNKSYYAVIYLRPVGSNESTIGDSYIFEWE